MEITVTREENCTILAITGKMDATNASEFETQVKEEMTAGATRFIVDLSGLEYISSAGLRGMLFLAKTVKGKGGTAVLCGLTGVVQQVFKMSGFSSIFTVSETLAEARQTV